VADKEAEEEREEEMIPDLFVVRQKRLPDGTVPIRDVMNIGDPKGPLFFEEAFHSEEDVRACLKRYRDGNDTSMVGYRVVVSEMNELED